MPASLLKSYVSLIAVSWSLTIQFAFNYFNEKKDTLFWLKLTQEIPTKSEHRVAGRTKKENQTFWLLEDKINFYWFKILNSWAIFFLVVCSDFTSN